MRIKGSEVLAKLPKYAFAQVEEEVKKLRESGMKAIDFGVGDHSLPTPEIVRNRGKQAIDEHSKSGYPSYEGSIDLRKAVAEWMQRRFSISLDSAKNITSTVGSKEGIFHVPFAFTNPGDYVILPTPAYPPYYTGTLFAGAKPFYVALRKEKNFLLDFNEIPKEIASQAKILWLCYPNSPTGVVADTEYFKKAIDFCNENKILLCSDEAYSEIYFGDTPPISALNVSVENVLAVFSMSKRSMMTGWRIGWVAGDEEAVQTFRAMKTNLDSGTPDFIQDAAIAALGDEEHVKEMREITKIKRNILCEALVKAGLEDCSPEATLYVWQKIPEGLNSIEFAKILLKPEIGIVCTPGELLSQPDSKGYNPGKNYVRFAIVPTEAEVKEAAKRLQNLKNFI